MNQGPYDSSFYQSQMEGSYRSARKVLAKFFQYYSPSSMVDFGCGVGTWLRAGADLGVSRVLGLDGEYVNRELLRIPPECFRSCDLAKDALRIDGSFDLAVSLEVVEHLPAERAAEFVAALCRAASVVLFAAAVPGQRGTHHVNEQFPSYWVPLFRAQGFSCFDFLRPAIWGDKDVEVWYRQNILVFARDLTFPCPATEASDVDRIHPELWIERGNVSTGVERVASVLSFEAKWSLPAPVLSVAKRLFRS